MSLSASLQVGRSGLLASQAALQVVGNNLANVATRGYHRQEVRLAPIQGQQIDQGIFIGRGVQIASITRVVNEALEARMRTAIGNESASGARYELLSQIEAIHNEFSGIDLSSRMAEFFNAWSELGNNPQDMSLRTLVVQQAVTLSDYIRTMREQFGDLRMQTDRGLDNAISSANDLLDQIQMLNQRIAASDQGGGGAASLRDQRDLALAELSKYLDISTVESPTGVVDIFVGSLPIMLNGQSRGLELQQRTVDGELEVKVVLADDKSPLDTRSGEIGALARFREVDLKDAIDTLDTFAGQLIWQVNRLHSQGQGLQGFTSVTGTNGVADVNAALNSDDAGMAFKPVHGSFQVHVTQQSTGQRVSETILVDLDGINPGSDTTLASLVSDLNSVDNISATILANGRVVINSDNSDFQITFSDDSSGVLAALGINTVFTGSNAFDIDVNQVVQTSPGLIAAAQGHQLGDNSNALAIAGLRSTPVSQLSGMSLSQYWSRHIEDVAIRTGQARSQMQADQVVRDNLENQLQSVSGVNADEEAIDLLQYQRAYQASARFLMVVDEMMQTLLAVV